MNMGFWRVFLSRGKVPIVDRLVMLGGGDGELGASEGLKGAARDCTSSLIVAQCRKSTPNIATLVEGGAIQFTITQLQNIAKNYPVTRGVVIESCCITALLQRKLKVTHLQE